MALPRRLLDRDETGYDADEAERREWGEDSAAGLLQLTESDPETYKIGFLDVDRNGYFVLVTDYSSHVNKVLIRNRWNCWRAFQGDEVVVLLFKSKQKQSYQCGKILGILQRNIYPQGKEFICTLDTSNFETSLFVPLRKGLPNFRIMANPKFDRRGCVNIMSQDEDDKPPKFERRIRVDFSNPTKFLYVVKYLKWKPTCAQPLVIVTDAIQTPFEQQYIRFCEDYIDMVPHLPHVDREALEIVTRSPQVLLEARQNHKDLRHLNVFTIDTEDAVYLDDAFSIEEGSTSDTYTVGIHVACVSSFVAKDSYIDREASLKLQTIYSGGEAPQFMLPQIINELCSLSRGKERLAISLFFTVSKEGRVVGTPDIQKSRVISKYQLTYGKAEELINNAPPNNLEIARDLSTLHKIVRKMRMRRLGTEYFCAIDEEYSATPQSHELVEELMFLTNSTVAQKLISWFGTGIPVRCQKPPRPSQVDDWLNKYEGLARNTFSLRKAIRAKRGQTCDCVAPCRCDEEGAEGPNDMKIYRRVLPKIADGALHNFYIWRQIISGCEYFPLQVLALGDWKHIQETAKYLTYQGEALTHFQLDSSSYTQFTSPMRRYIDLIVQRLVDTMIQGENSSLYAAEELDDICYRSTRKEIALAQYEERMVELQAYEGSDNDSKFMYGIVKDPAESDKHTTLLMLHPTLKVFRDVYKLILSFNTLNLILKPELEERDETQPVLRLVWKLRMYDMAGLYRVSEEQSATVSMEIDRWRSILRNLAAQNVPDLQEDLQQFLQELYRQDNVQVPQLCSDDDSSPHHDIHADRVQPHTIHTIQTKTMRSDSSSSTTKKRETHSHASASTNRHTNGSTESDVSNYDTASKSRSGAPQYHKDYPELTLICEKNEPRAVGTKYREENNAMRRQKEDPESIVTKHYQKVTLCLSCESILAVQVRLCRFRDTDIHLVKVRKNLTICTEHNGEPIICFSKASTRVASKPRYNNPIDYGDSWYPSISMEAAYTAIDDGERAYLFNVEVQWQNDKREKPTPIFSLTAGFCKTYHISLSSGDYVCLQLEPENLITWVGHFLVKSVRERTDPNSFEITLRLHQSSVKTPDLLYNRSRNICNIEWISKSVQAKRMGASVWKVREEDTSMLAKQIALGERTSEVPLPRSTVMLEEIPGLEPNQGQQRAIRMALKQKFSVIQGPPGTGKSITGVGLAVLFSRQNKMKEQVLYCGPSNKSVDVVAEYFVRKLIKKKDFPQKVLRVYGSVVENNDFPIPGTPVDPRLEMSTTKVTSNPLLRDITLHYKIREGESETAKQIRDFDRKFRAFLHNPSETKVTYRDIEEYQSLLKTAYERYISAADIIFCTCASAGSEKMTKATKIRQVIVDEAAMCTEPETMIPIVHAKYINQVVLIGDHKQLQPIVKALPAKKLGLDISLFQRYADNQLAQGTMLNEQYRMHKAIQEFPSAHSYDNKLKEITPEQRQPSTFNIWPGGRDCPIAFCHVEGEEVSLPVSTAEGSEESKSNLFEVHEVVRYAKYLVGDLKQKASQVVILSFYRSQCTEIQQRLSEDPQCKNIPVFTVVKSQGSEWDYVLLTTVRSLPTENFYAFPSKNWQHRNIGIAADANQINVAITRARKGLVIVGNKRLLRLNETWQKLLEHYEARGAVVDAEDFMTGRPFYPVGMAPTHNN